MRYLLFLLFPILLCGQDSTSYYVTYDRSELDSINVRINTGLDTAVKGYEAVKYFTVQYDSVSQRYWAEIPVKEKDSRNPQRFLTDMEKVSLVDKTYMIKQRLISE